MDFSIGKQIIIEQLAADYGVRASALFDVAVHSGVGYGENAKTYLSGAPFLDMTYVDGRIVAACDARMAEFVGRYIAAAREPFRAFDAPNIMLLNAELNKFGMTVGHILQGCLPRECGRPSIPSGMRVYIGKEIDGLYTFKGFNNALCYSTAARRRDEIAVAYFDGNEPVAVAACSNDGERMWQIGVDVKPQYRKGGLAKALVGALKDLIGERGICPYYCCAWSNVPSQRTASAAGFVPAWAELSAMSLDDRLFTETAGKLSAV